MQLIAKIAFLEFLLKHEENNQIRCLINKFVIGLNCLPLYLYVLQILKMVCLKYNFVVAISKKARLT